MSRNELAQRADLAISALQRIEQSPGTSIQMKTLRKLAEGLGMTATELVEKIAANGHAHESGIAPDQHAKPVPDFPTFDIDVAAGVWTPVEVCELHYDDPVARAILESGRFRLRILGDSMQPKYPSGSTVEFVILRAYDAPTLNDDYAICRSDGTGTFKTLVRITDDAMILRAINRRKYPEQIEVARQEVARMARAVGVFIPVDQLVKGKK